MSAVATLLVLLPALAAPVGDVGTTPMPPAGVSGPASYAPDDPTGAWRMEVVVTTRVDIPVLGEIRSRTYNRLRVDVFRGPDGWMQRHRLCEARIVVPEHYGKTTLPPAFIEAMPSPVYRIELRDDGSYEADPGPVAVGFRDDGGAMPETVRDPRVLDWDRDGLPGATILVDVPLLGHAVLQVVQRGHMRYRGARTGPDSFAGTAQTLRMEQRTLASSHPLLGRSLASEPVDGESSFVMTRLPPDAAEGCAAL